METTIPRIRSCLSRSYWRSGAGDDMAASAAAAVSRSGNGDFAVRLNGEY